MKVTIRDVERRFVPKVVKQDGIIGYDVDNAYPQKVMRMVGGSGTARNCVNLYAKFMNGRGQVNEDHGKTPVNRKGLTVNGLSTKTIKDFAIFGGFAIHVNYNLAFEKTGFSSIPFEQTRLTLPDDKDYHGRVKTISVYPDWAREHSRQIKKDKIKEIHLFDDDPEVIAKQIESVGGINNWNGQIMWFSNMGKGYPLPIYDPVLEDIDTDAQIKIFRNSNVRTGFSASHLFIHKGIFEDDVSRQEFNDRIGEFQGADVAGSMMVIEVEREEQIPELIKVESQLDARVIKVTNSNTKDSIIEAFGMPSVLVNADNNEGVTFSNDLLKLSYDYYNSITEPERMILEEQFTKLFAGSFLDTTPFDINPLEWIVDGVAEPTPTP